MSREVGHHNSGARAARRRSAEPGDAALDACHGTVGLPPSHHYLAAYRWLEHGFEADAVVHLGKHGSMEWLPGKNAALSASCGPDAAIGSMPLIYPFLVNDPGEGAQAKRRAHATIVDHLVPPMARAEPYGDIARLGGCWRSTTRSRRWTRPSRRRSAARSGS
ncbi:CobN/Magnesium Chelatase [Nocardioides terrae]|uniref:CobN/Magnesium Chelatase n=1 Tax=Nocardioides terrae TaxID=574651 RepID=A0A1I1L2Y0_9ACTN|nr:CobN/Magnesium Chelatase [Nocardioides terrae]